MCNSDKQDHGQTAKLSNRINCCCKKWMISFPSGISKEPNLPLQPFIAAVDSQPASSWDSCPARTAVAPWHHHLFHFNDAGYLENDDVILRRRKWVWAAVNDLVARPVSRRECWSLHAAQLGHSVALQCKESRFGLWPALIIHIGNYCYRVKYDRIMVKKSYKFSSAKGCILWFSSYF